MSKIEARIAEIRNKRRLRRLKQSRNRSMKLNQIRQKQRNSNELTIEDMEEWKWYNG